MTHVMPALKKTDSVYQELHDDIYSTLMNIAANLPPYPAYKPSGVEWLGDVPAHWEVRRLKKIVYPDSVKEGYAISFTRYIYKPQPLRAPHEIWADI